MRLQMIEVDTEMCRYFVTEGLTEDSVSALLHRGRHISLGPIIYNCAKHFTAQIDISS